MSVIRPAPKPLKSLDDALAQLLAFASALKASSK